MAEEGGIAAEEGGTAAEVRALSPVADKNAISPVVPGMFKGVTSHTLSVCATYT